MNQNKVVILSLIASVLIPAIIIVYTATFANISDTFSPFVDRVAIDLTIPHNDDITEVIETGIFPNSVPSLSYPQFETVTAASTYIEQDALGIGIEKNGVSKFYPNQLLIWHSVVNDNIDGTPILISYCPFCSSSVVYSRNINDQILEFQTSSKLWKNNLLIRDISESPSLWSSLIGEGIYGNYNGQKLELLESDNITFGEWVQKQPNTMVLSSDTGYERPYDVDPLKIKSIYDDFSNPDPEIDPRAFLNVVIYKNNAYAVSQSKLLQDFNTTINELDFTISFQLGTDRVQSLLQDHIQNSEAIIDNITAPYFLVKAIYPNAKILL